MGDPGPTRTQGDLSEMLETLLDKGVVVNADIAVTVGDTELLGIRLRAAVASFETAAEYGLAFPAGTDMEKVKAASGVEDPGGADDAGANAAVDPGEDDGVGRPTGGLDLDAGENGDAVGSPAVEADAEPTGADAEPTEDDE